MKIMQRFIYGSLLAAFALTASAQFDFGKLKGIIEKATAAKEVNEKEEVEIGKGVASNLLGAAPLVNDARLQKYVNAVGRWLAMQTERPDLEWHFGVFDSPNVNAFATPGGYIFVTKGLVMKMRNEAELAGVLAHEIAHVLQKHHLKAIQKNAMVGLGTDIASMVARKDGKNTEAFNKVVNVGTQLYARGLDREDELEADRMGVVIAARAGYDPYGLPAVLQTLEGVNPQDGNFALMFKTHPTPASRLEALDKIMATGVEKYANQPQLEGRFEKAVGQTK